MKPSSFKFLIKDRTPEQIHLAVSAMGSRMQNRFSIWEAEDGGYWVGGFVGVTAMDRNAVYQILMDLSDEDIGIDADGDNVVDR